MIAHSLRRIPEAHSLRARAAQSAFMGGALARVDGVGLGSNPYPPVRGLNFLWFVGWCSGGQLDGVIASCSYFWDDHKPWDSRDCEILALAAGAFDWPIIAAMLGRTPDACRHKARRLGLAVRRSRARGRANNGRR